MKKNVIFKGLINKQKVGEIFYSIYLFVYLFCGGGREEVVLQVVCILKIKLS